jgi:hypothetical protein
MADAGELDTSGIGCITRVGCCASVAARVATCDISGVLMECRADLGPGAGACIGVRIGVSVRDLALPLEEGGAKRSGSAFWLFIGDMCLVCDCNTGIERRVELRKSDKAWDWIKGH